MDFKLKKLVELYNHKSRHSQYQCIPPSVENFIKCEKPLKSKYEYERLEYINSNVDLNGKTILDIGGNTGYFTIESLKKQEPIKIDYYEGNKEHAEFVKLSSDVLGLSDKIHVHDEYFDFNNRTNDVWDVVYFLNVIHHIGFDFEKDVNISDVKDKMILHINNMSKYCRILVFQMGFNWYGNIDKCLFANGTKKEMEDYILNGTKDYWELLKIGIAEKKDNGLYKYFDMNNNNNKRMDEYGEFLNRPIFIMRSKSF